MTRRRSNPLAASRTYYPGFFAALFLVLLRIAIGWHFHNEGNEKIAATKHGGKPFTAEPYLRASAGPLAPYFRGLVPDVNGLAKLDPVRLKGAWKADVDRVAAHYAFDADQRGKADQALADADQFVDDWFGSRDFAEKRAKYVHELAQVQAVERNPRAMSYERERAAEKRKELDKDRRDLLKEIDARAGVLRDAVVALATPDQTRAAGVYSPPMTELDRINLATTYGLWAIGLCLMLGFLTRPAALAGAVFLGQIYLSMPPWPGLPSPPQTEGHYYIVSKNLIEMLALLALVFLPTGRWLGLDSLFAHLFGRRRREAEVFEDLGPEPTQGRKRRAFTSM